VWVEGWFLSLPEWDSFSVVGDALLKVRGGDGLACLGCSLPHPGKWVKDKWHISCSPSTGVSTGLSPGREEAGVVSKCVDNSLMRSRVCSSLPLR